MSLALIEGYSSAEDDEDNNNNNQLSYQNSSEEDGEGGAGLAGGGASHSRRENSSSVFDFSKHLPSGSVLPSAFDVFSEITGLPKFLNIAEKEETLGKGEEEEEEEERRVWHGRRRKHHHGDRDKRDLPAVWTAEASQSMELGVGKQPIHQLGSSSYMQCQPNLAVSREFCSKTVDEVWKSIQERRRKNDQLRLDQERQPTLGEMTLEDFLEKAGIASDSTREMENDDGILGEDQHGEFSPQPNWMQFQLSPVQQTQACHQQNQQLAQSISGFMSSHSHLQQPIHNGISPMMDVVFPEPQLTVTVSLSRCTLLDTQTLGRKRVAPGGVVEKTVERRQKRMIKNRESAARSRARKQAYTNELENKIAHLEEEIERLKKQQVYIMCIFASWLILKPVHFSTENEASNY